MLRGGVVVAGERNMAIATHRGDGPAVGVGPGCRQRDLLFFIAQHLLMS